MTSASYIPVDGGRRELTSEQGSRHEGERVGVKQAERCLQDSLGLKEVFYFLFSGLEKSVPCSNSKRKGEGPGGMRGRAFRWSRGSR